MANFKAPYNKENALSFLDKFLPEDFQQFDEKIEVDFKPQFIRSIKKIGEAPSLDNLHIYEINHESENDPRVSLSKDSFRLLAHFNVKKALIFFVSKTSYNYRLSLVTVDLKWESGVRVKREYSNPRRYSFFLGPDARVHTPNDFLIKKDRVKDIVDLLSRFDVEIVTKEFFTKYKGLFENVRNYLEQDHGFKIFAGKNDIDIDTFAKKLLGQIVFCYFLQRKGWLGAKREEPINKGDKDFMRSLFNHCAEGKNFYNDYLEYLFYGSLNNRAEGSGDFYRKHFDCQIPFLNGGLFEPPEDYEWEKSFVHIPDKIFSNKQNAGILDVFDLYNFTVYEDDPIDREVSVDPEMLGKVFENLLPENLRRGQGAYYTPREIVHYMCQESLINYLATDTKVDTDRIRDLVVNKQFEGEGNRESVDRALQNIKVCDPACGSGAFLVGMLHEIVSARRILNPKKDEYHLKKETIQDCIYGVDIDPGAVDIAKLRLWLSLVVDYELKEIEPLPNLDYKIMCGNSLLEELIIGEESIKLFDERLLNISKGVKAKSSLFNDEEFKGKSISARNEYLQNQLKVKQNEMLKLHSENQLTPERRKELDREIEALNKELNPKSKKQVIDYHPTLFGDKAEKYFNLLKELHKQYFTEYDPKRKREKRKQIENIEMEFIKSSVKEKVDDIGGRIKNLNIQDPADRKLQASLMKKKLEYLAIPEQIHNSQSKPYFLWRLNFFEVFQEKGGFDVVIANPPWVFTREGDFEGHLKKYLIDSYLINLKGSQTGRAKQSGKINLFAIFILQGLRILNKDRFLTFIIPNTILRATVYDAIRKFILDNYRLLTIADLSSGVFANVTASTIITIIQNQINNINQRIEVIKSFNSDRKFEISKVLQDSFSKNISYTFNIYSSKESELILQKIHLISKKLDTHFDVFAGGIATGPGKNKYISDKPISNKYKPLIEGKDIKRYKIEFKNKYILYDRKILYRAREENIFLSSEKLVTQRIGGGDYPLIVAYDKSKFYTFNSTNSILKKEEGVLSLKYLLPLLNSKLLNWYYTIQFTNKSTLTVNISKTFLEQLPIRVISLNEQKPFADIVDKILAITEDVDYMTSPTKQSKVCEYERQIDQMVYELYGLTKEEIKVVENFGKERDT